MGPGGKVWIGYDDRAEVNHWTWSDGSNQYPYTNWNKGEPNGGSRENCAYMRNDGFWNDFTCTTKMRFVCKVISSTFIFFFFIFSFFYN